MGVSGDNRWHILQHYMWHLTRHNLPGTSTATAAASCLMDSLGDLNEVGMSFFVAPSIEVTSVSSRWPLNLTSEVSATLASASVPAWKVKTLGSEHAR